MPRWLSTNHVSGELSTLCFLAAFIPFAALLITQEPLPGKIPFGT